MSNNKQRAGRSSGRRRAVGDTLRTQLWPLPAISVVAAIGLGIWLPMVDAALGGDLPPAVANLLIGGGSDAARAILQATAGSLITVTSLTFSLTVVTLQLASSQFSPRLLRMFTADRVVHATLALFLATFAYALTVLRTVRTGDDGQEAFVPHLSVTFAFLLAIASVLGLVFFLAHLAREIRVETIMRKVHRETLVTIQQAFPDQRGPSQPALPQPPGSPLLIEAARSGFLTGMDEDRLLAVSVKHGAVIRMDSEPGASLVQGVPLGAGWIPDGGPALDDDAQQSFQDDVAAAVTTGFERTAVQDVGFGFRQLIDVASKALSPSTNDPTTAIHVLGHASSLLCELARRDLGPRTLRDDDGRVRVILHRLDFAGFLDVTLDQPTLYGSSDPAVVERILRLLQEVAWCAAETDRAAIREQLLRVTTAMQRETYPSAVRAHLDRLVTEVEEALDGHWASRAALLADRT